MANGTCDICHWRPATHTITTTRNGRQQTVELCDIDYAHGRNRAPASSADPFTGGGGSLFDWLNRANQPPESLENFFSDINYPLPREREATNIEDYLSDNTKEIIEGAAETAVKFGRKEVDTEHLLYALAGSVVVTEILRQFNLKTDDIRGYIDENAPKDTEVRPENGQIEVSVSPRLKAVLENAFQISRELGHGYIGPEHLLIVLAEEDEGLAGDVLRKYGLTPQAIRQKTIKVVGKGARELRRRIKTEVENKLAGEMLSGRLSEGSAVTVGYDHNTVVFKEAPAAKQKPAHAKRS